jgi:hypothetical protein
VATHEPKTIKETRNQVKPGEVFYYADEFNLSWMPTLRAMWSPKGQQVMIPMPGQPHKRYGLGGVNYHAGETVVLCRRHKRRREVAELLQALVNKHPTGTIHARGTMPVPASTTTSKPSYVQRRNVWCSCIGRPTAPG